MTTTFSPAYEHLFHSFGLKENPFRVSPDPRFLFLGRAYRTVLSELTCGIESHHGLLVLTGEPGAGKTMLLRRVLQWLNDKAFSTSYIFHSHLNTAEMFEFIARDFGLQVESSRKSDLLAALQKWLQARHAAGDSPVVVIDEAQALSVRALSELCLLLNLENSRGKLLQIVLAGQPELEEKLRRPDLRQLRQRITVRCRLPLLSLEETGEYVASRLRSAGGTNTQIFSPETLQALYSYAQGIPRVTNLLCEKALLAAYAERRAAVSVANVRRAASEFDFALEPAPQPHPEITLETSLVLPLVADDVHAGSPASPPANTPPPLIDEPLQVVETIVELPAAPAVPRPKRPIAVFPSPSASPAPAPEMPVVLPEAVVETPVPSHGEFSFRRYWREVAESFVHDWRHFVTAFKK